MKESFEELFERAQKLEDLDFHGWLCHAFGAFSVNAGKIEYDVIFENLERLEGQAQVRDKSQAEEA